MNAVPAPRPHRLILAHKHPTSARLRFVRFPHGMWAFEPVPAASQRCAKDAFPRKVVSTLPSVHLAAAERQLGLPPGSLKLEDEFEACLDAEGACLEVLLATFTSIDPPFAAIEAAGARFVHITEARDCAPLELEMLRLAYEVTIGG